MLLMNIAGVKRIEKKIATNEKKMDMYKKSGKKPTKNFQFNV